MTTEELLDDAAPEWLRSEEGTSVILFSRMELYRNIKGMKFPLFSDHSDRTKAESEVDQAIQYWNQNELDPFSSCRLTALSETEKSILQRKGLIPKNVMDQSMLYVNEKGTTTVFVNGTDHIKMQCQQAGGMTGNLWKRCSQLDDELSYQIDYAFDGEFGYLTSSPVLVGTGMRLSAVLFLPGICRSGTLQLLSNRLIKEGFSMHTVLDDLYGEDVPLFEITSAISTGISEPELTDLMDSLLEDVQKGELRLRKEMLQREESFIKDEIWRALGTLKYARYISQEESACCICALAWGIAEDMIPCEDSLLFPRLLSLCQAPWVRHITHKEELSQEDECLWRAVLLREEIKKAGL